MSARSSRLNHHYTQTYRDRSPRTPNYSNIYLRQASNEKSVPSPYRNVDPETFRRSNKSVRKSKILTQKSVGKTDAVVPKR